MCVCGVSSLEEALWNMFVEEELFEGNNLYRCAQCDRLVTAAKVSSSIQGKLTQYQELLYFFVNIKDRRVSHLAVILHVLLLFSLLR